MKVARQRESGGGLPAVPVLWQEALQDVVENVGAYVQIGLAFMLVAMPLGMVIAFGGMFVLYGLMAVGGVGSAVAGRVVGEAVGRDAGGLVTVAGVMASGLCSFGGFAGVLALGTAAMAPLSASITRAIAAFQRGEGELSFQSAFSTMKQDIGQNVTAMFCVVSASFVGVCFCYVGALVPAALFTFVLPMVALHRVSAMAAMRRCASDALANPVQHLTYAVAYTITALISAYVPLLGHVFILALSVRAYRRLYGDGAEIAVVTG